MKTLSTTDFARARSYLKTHARMLERRLFAFYFENEPLDDTVGELSQFQNEDGGFGNAIEPDFRMPESSPMATNMALQIAMQIEAPSSQPSVANAVRYILGCYDARASAWPSASSEINNHPHAPWWHYDAIKKKVAVESAGNPTAQIVRSLLSWPELMPAGFLDSLTNLNLKRILDLPFDAGMHEMLCYLELVEGLPAAKRGPAEARIKDLILLSVARDPAAWAEYGPQPLFFVSSPESILFEDLRPAIEANLDYLIDHQDPAGGWAPNWDWGTSYPEVWSIARLEWQGVITLKNLQKLKAFGRLV